MAMSAAMEVEVVVVGSSNMDLIAYVARLPIPGETLMGARDRQG
jgi:sugar/nucleoside kinase (ribokinase family)